MPGDTRGPGDWERVRQLFGEALVQDESVRDGWLARVAGDDAALLAEVRSLLARVDDSRDGGPMPPVDSTLAPDQNGDLFGPPKRIGAYTVLSVIGEGGMGWVLEARQLNPDRRVALKVVKAAIVSADMRRRFEQEARVLARLRHPAIAQIYEAGTATIGTGAEAPYFAMELVEGARPITQYAADAAIALDRKLELLADVADGIEHGHQRGVVHRDLKPGNVLVDATGRPRIVDFGLARAVGDDFDAVSMHTRTGQVLGTPQYMSPEQFGGRPADVTTSTDVYSLGVLLYELVSGELPYQLEGASLFEMAQIVREQAPRRIVRPRQGSRSDLRKRADLDTIIGKAMEKDPARRYASAAALASDLRRLVRGEPIMARPASALYHLRLFARRNKAVVASVIALNFVLAIALAVTLMANAESRTAREAAERQADRTALSAAVLAQQADDFEAAETWLDMVPVGRRDWIWSWLAAQNDKPVLAFGGRSIAFTPQGDFRTVQRNVVEEWRLADGHRHALASLQIADSDLVGLTPDGALVLTVNGTHCRVLDARTGGEFATFEVHPNVFGSRTVAALSSARIAYRTEAAIVVRELRTGAEIRSVPRTADTSVHAISRDGTLLAVSDEKRGVYVLDLATGAPLAGFEPCGYAIWNAAFSDDGRLLATTEGNQFGLDSFSPEVIVWDVATGQRAYPRAMRVPGLTRRVVFSPDGNQLAVATNQSVVLLEPRDRQIARTFLGLPDDVRHIAFAPDGKAIAMLDGPAYGRPGTARDSDGMVWVTGDPGRLAGHASFVYPVAFSPDGALVASGGWNGEAGEPDCVRIWDALTGAPVAAFGGHGRMVSVVAFTPDGSRLLASGRIDEQRTVLRTWDVTSGTLLDEIESVPTFSLSPDGSVLAAVRLHDADTEFIELVDMATKAVRRGPPNRNTSPRPAPAFRPDGRRIASCPHDNTIHVWDVATLASLVVLSGHEDVVTGIVFSADGRRIVSSSADDTVRLWNAETGEPLAVLRGPRSDAMCAQFAPDGRHILSGSRDGVIRIWDPAERTVIAALSSHRAYVYSLSFSPDGRTLASGSGDRTVRLWRDSSRAELRRLRAEREALVVELIPLVLQRFAELTQAAAVAARLRTELTGRRLEVALQIVLGESLRRRP